MVGKQRNHLPSIFIRVLRRFWANVVDEYYYDETENLDLKDWEF